MTSKIKVKEYKLTKAQKATYDSFGDNKSAKIRFLSSLGWDRSPIAKFVGVIYQFVRNVQENEIARKARAADKS